MLWPELEPALLIRLEGPEIKPGNIPSAALAQANNIARKALKPVFEWAARGLPGDTTGRPPTWLQQLYALPTQRLGYGSLEIAFGMPKIPEPSQASLPGIEVDMRSRQQIQEKAGAALQDGLAWASSADDIPRDQQEKWVAILRTLKHLTPAAKGAVTNVDVSGRLVGRTEHPFTLERATTKRVRSAIAELRKARRSLTKTFEGRIRDLDYDKLTMVLREEGETPDVPLVLPDDKLLDQVKAAHYRELLVRVTAMGAGKEKVWSVVGVEVVREL